MAENNISTEKLNAEQRKLYEELIKWKPEYEKFCKAEISENGNHNLYIEIPSPTGDQERKIVVWIDDGDISIGFGPWHTHGSIQFETDKKGYCDEVSIIDLIKMIVSGELVYFTKIGNEKQFSDILNLTYPNALAEELTDQYSTGTIDIKSWDGNQDRRVFLADLKI